MIRAIAIDDEPPALRIIEYFCRENNSVELVQVFTNPKSALEFIERNTIDLMFIDIQMPDDNGIVFYEQLKKKPLAIFTTAYSEYAVEGFNVNAVDYLLKPYSKERFNLAIRKATERINMTNSLDKTITLRTNYSIKQIRLNDILFIESFGDYVRFHLISEGEIEIRQTLKKTLEQLPDDEFLRVHRSYIVPLQKISAVRNKFIHIQDQKIPVSTNYEKEFFERFRPK